MTMFDDETPSTGALCTTCASFPPQLFLPGHAVEHLIHTRQITKEQSTKCDLCRLLVEALGLGDGLAEANSCDVVTIRTQWSHPEGDTFRGWLMVYDGRRRLSRLRFSIKYHQYPVLQHEDLPALYERTKLYFRDPTQPQGSLSPKTASSRYQPLSLSSDTVANVALVNDWLDKCEAEHESCKVDGMHVDQANFILPSRLLDTEYGVRLVDSSTLPRTAAGYGPPYATLSHCWGSTPELIPKCTTHNLEALQNDIDIYSLPKTFQHAIVVARRIGVQYLWIDSLCIVQDSAEDKNKEISRMHLIYSMGICTIVAAAASDSRGGCFVERIHRDARPFSMKMTHDDAEFTVSFHQHLGHFFDVINNGPLSTRGWCYQERQLSKRIIYFTGKGIAWECREAVATEEYPDMVERAQSDFQLKARIGPDRLLDGIWAISEITRANWIGEMQTRNALNQANPRLRNMGFNETHMHWMMKWGPIVEEYSSRLLTFEGDRLPALGGLAAIISALLESPFKPLRHIYLAGLFRTDLIRHLCWFPDLQAPCSRRSEGGWPPPLRDAPAVTTKTISDRPTLPSWSWISIDGPVCYYDTDNDFLTESYMDEDEKSEVLENGLTVGALGPIVVDGKVDLVVPSYQFGAVSAGLITIYGLTLQIDISESHLMPEPNKSVLPKCYPMFPHLEGPAEDDMVVYYPGDARFMKGVIYFDLNPEVLPTTTLYCLRLGLKPSLVSAARPVWMGLVLLEVIGSKLPGGESAGQRFRRVGMFEIAWHHPQFLKDARLRSLDII